MIHQKIAPPTATTNPKKLIPTTVVDPDECWVPVAAVAVEDEVWVPAVAPAAVVWAAAAVPVGTVPVATGLIETEFNAPDLQ